MKCSCVYVGYDCGDSCYILQEKIVRAAKPHKCGECGSDICKGEKCEIAYIVQNIQVSTEKTCMNCLSIRREFFCDGWTYTCILDDLREHISGVKGDISESCIASLTPKARERVCEMVERSWDATP